MTHLVYPLCSARRARFPVPGASEVAVAAFFTAIKIATTSGGDGIS